MKTLAFSARNRKELLRDPLNLVFGLGFPIVLITLMSLLNRSLQGMPTLFSIERLTPAMAVFGLSFITLFSGMLIAGDRDSSFLTRIFASPMRASDYIAGYSLPLVVMSVLQAVICFAAALLFGLTLTLNIFAVLAVLLPVALLFIALGILLGTLFTNKQVGAVASILINVTAWLSGTWFDLDLIGGTFEKICYLLPFAHAVSAARDALAGNFDGITAHLIWVAAYAAVLFAVAIYLFKKKMKH